MIVVVGSNPSSSSPDDSPFHISTRSRMVLDAWFHGIDDEIRYLNVSNIKKEDNKALTRNEILESIPDLNNRLKGFSEAKIVALGTTAALALTLLQVPHYPMPHPSGMCRVWNDKVKSKEFIDGLRRYIQT